ncbi:MAG: sugar kinase [Desulfuromonadales bacterium C00003093]|nr:MAG: sugar kinase [Desulfuromonadales bacterium C00003093]
MLAIVGTVPSEGFPITSGKITLDDDHIRIGDERISVNRGTMALMAAASKTAETLGRPAPFGYLVGDIGRGKGSRNLYKYLTEQLPQSSFQTLTFHYLQPILHWHEHLQQAIDEMKERPTLIADAGFMYAAKMSGKASQYDLFTPDIGELAFLADEKAPHPFYTRGFILHDENRVPDLISRAYAHNNAARFLLVKGKRDYLANREGILETVDNPVEEALEAMGGTGDTLTGLVSALIDSGMAIQEAAVVAMKTNRLAGHYAKPTPATQVAEIIRHIPKALAEVLEKR